MTAGAEEERAETARLVSPFFSLFFNAHAVAQLFFLCVCVCVCVCVYVCSFVFHAAVFCMFLIFAISHAQSSFVGAIAIGELVKSTLGPKGMVRVYLIQFMVFFLFVYFY